MVAPLGIPSLFFLFHCHQNMSGITCWMVRDVWTEPSCPQQPSQGQFKWAGSQPNPRHVRTQRRSAKPLESHHRHMSNKHLMLYANEVYDCLLQDIIVELDNWCILLTLHSSSLIYIGPSETLSPYSNSILAVSSQVFLPLLSC